MARPAEPQRRGWLARLAAALLFGCSAPLISTFTGSGSALSIAGLRYGGATLAWGIDNNISQRLSLRNPIQIATFKAAGTSVPTLTLALVLGDGFPGLPATLGLLAIGALGYGISPWLDLLALRDLGAAREAMLFSTAPFIGALFSLAVLRKPFTPPLLLAAGLMASGLGLLLRERHSHWHRHGGLEHAHPHVSDAHHRHPH